MRINDIPTEKFRCIIAHLLTQGWIKTYEFDGAIAWIDYAEVHICRGDVTVKFFWDNWCEGDISAEQEIEEIRILVG